MLKDPVCGMQVDPEKMAYLFSIYQIQTHYFYSEVCKGVFDGEPEKCAAAPSPNGETYPQQQE